VPQEFLSGESLFRDITTYVQMGEHRTGTPGEECATAWIAEELKKAGLRVSFQDLTLRQFFVHTCSLAADDRMVPCFPWWYPRGTGPRPLRAELASFGAEGMELRAKIALVKQQGRWMSARLRDTVDSMVSDMASAGALAVVFVSESPSGELVAVNTSDTAQPWPIPVVLAGPRDEQTLAVAASNHIEVSLLVDGIDETKATARNVFGRWGNDHGDVIVVSTPKSGWFTCGGERGPGIAIVLALARWIGQRRPRTNFWLDFNTGHELFNLGTRKFLAEAAPPPDRVRLWLHLGANIATYRFEDTTAGIKRFADPAKYPVVASHAEILPLVKQSFSRTPEIKPEVRPGVGEFGPVAEAGYRGFGIYGGPYRYFHNPGDALQGTSPELLEPVMQAVINAIEAIEELPRK